VSDIEDLRAQVDALIAERDAAYSRGYNAARIEPVGPRVVSCAVCQCINVAGIDCACAALAQLRSDLARVTQERDEAIREVQRKGAREIGLLSRALAAETQSDITQDALTAMRQERDALSAQLTTAVRDARATAAGDIQRAEAERDTALSDLAKMTEERDALAVQVREWRHNHDERKKERDAALCERDRRIVERDRARADVTAFTETLTAMRHRAEAAERERDELRAAVWKDTPSHLLAVRMRDLDEMRHRAERAEEELAGAWKNHDAQVAAKKRLVVAVRNETESNTAERIAAWLDERCEHASGGVYECIADTAKLIRAGAWKRETT
jgi:hypothetical protein